LKKSETTVAANAFPSHDISDSEISTDFKIGVDHNPANFEFPGRSSTEDTDSDFITCTKGLLKSSVDIFDELNVADWTSAWRIKGQFLSQIEPEAFCECCSLSTAFVSQQDFFQSIPLVSASIVGRLSEALRSRSQDL
jgi:hypothetical protein